MDFLLWKGILVTSGIQLVLSFMIGIFVIHISSFLLKFKTKRWITAIKVSAIVNVLNSILLLIPYLFPESFTARVTILIASQIVVLIVGAYAIMRFYRASVLKGALAILIFLAVNFVLGFPIGLLLAYVAYFLKVSPMPV